MASATGEKGKVELDESQRRPAIVTEGNKKWKYDGKRNNVYQTEHDEMFAAIRAGKPINNGEYMAKSTLLAIMGRMATYTGQEITWDHRRSISADVQWKQTAFCGRFPFCPIVAAAPTHWQPSAERRSATSDGNATERQ